MSLKKLAELRRTLAFRLTLWYAGMLLLSAAIAFAIFLYLITAALRGRTDQELLAGVRSLSVVMVRQGLEAVKRQALLESQAAGEKKIFIQLVYPDGRLFSSSNMSYFQHIPVSAEAIGRMLAQGEPLLATVRSPDRSHEIRVVYALIGPGLVVHLGQAMEDLARVIEAFQRGFAVVMAALFVLAAGIGWFMARRALSGVENVTRTAQRISGGSLAERVPVRGREDEIDRLAVTFNRMLDRIQTLVTGIKEMTDNIAHDLKSPITRIRGQAELALTGGGRREDYEAVAGSAVEECDRLLEMIDTMLFISRTEAGVTQGDTRLIQRMLANLLDNAIKYTPSGGAVSVSARRDSLQRTVIEVSDTGPGISEADLPHIFERFYRGDPSRSQAGAGLGLCFARAVAHAHGGEITAASLQTGSVFWVTIPATSA